MSVLTRVIFDPDTIPPSAPTGVAASALSSSAIRVTWSASTDSGGSGLAGYRVYRSATSGGTYTQVSPDLSTASLAYDDAGLSPSTQYFYRVRAFDGNANQSAQSATANATTQAGAPSNDFSIAAADSDVVWWHNFVNAAELNVFRWMNIIGNDPNSTAPSAGNARLLAGQGPDGANCVEFIYPAGTSPPAVFWWRPTAPMLAPGNGKDTDDPGANGTITRRTWSPVNGSATANFSFGWYGHPTYANADTSHFDGNEFFLRIRVKADPNRITGGNASATVGKFVWLTTAEGADSLSDGEHVIWSYGNGGNQGSGRNYVRVYSLGVTNNSDPFAPLDQEEPGTRIQPGSDLAEDVYYSGNWDTLLVNIRPGLIGVTTGPDATRLRIWIAREGEPYYTKIWDQEYGLNGYQARNGLQALILSQYNNGFDFPQQFFHRYAQPLFSKSFVAPPGTHDTTLGQACAALSSGQSATFTPGTQHNMASPPDGGATGPNRLEWQSTFYHDRVHNIVRLMGKSAQNEGGPDDWRMKSYSLALNAWTSDDFNFNRLGHVYGSWSIDPFTGNQWGVPGTSDSRDLWMRTYTTGAWSTVSSAFAGVGRSVNGPNALVFHPNLFGRGDEGVVVLTEWDNISRIICYRRSTGAISIFNTGVDMGTSPLGCFWPAQDAAIIGKTQLWSVTPHATPGGSPVITSLGAPPIQVMGTGTTSGVHGAVMTHPGNKSKLLLLEKVAQTPGAPRYWTSTNGSSWGSSLGTHPFNWVSTNNNATFCSLENNLGCVWGIGASGGSTLRSTLWRPPV